MRMRGRPPHTATGVTPRQREVARLVAAGYTNERIASELRISHDGAKYHVSELLSRLGVERRDEIAAWYREQQERPSLGRRLRSLFGLPLAWGVGGAAAAVAIVALVIALPLALSSDDDGTVGLGAIVDADGALVALLSLVPDTPDARARVHMTDTASIRAMIDAEPPPDDDPDSGYINRWAAFANEHDAWEIPAAVPSFWGTGGRILDYLIDMTGTLEASIGFDLSSVDGWVATGGGSLPAISVEEEIHGLIGPLDADALASAIETCAECREPDVSAHQGWNVYSWGDDFQEGVGQRLEPPIFDNLGRGGRLALADGLAVRAYYTAGVEAMIDAYEDGPTLYEDDDFRLAAEGLQALGAQSAYLTDQPLLMVEQVLDSDEEADDELGLGQRAIDALTPRSDDTLLTPYQVVGAGFGWDGVTYAAVALVHDSVEAAEENASRFADRVATARFAFIGATSGVEGTWADVFDDVTVEVEGRLLVARLDMPASLTDSLSPDGDVRLNLTQFTWESIIAAEPLFQWE